ncbi:multicopper oxidase domain-containing protein [Candidatus Dependentiae bacterium]|nr:multicopper oxidase domain-containing protein [Candidatus Dependentiae bacterium]
MKFYRLSFIIFCLVFFNFLFSKMMKIPFNRWKSDKISISVPPKTMGKQMGVVNTVGLKSLGYELDGDVKVFKLIAQPIEKYLTDGKDVNKGIIPEKFLYTNRMKHISKKVKLWGYNGSVPGPTIEVYQGDRVRIIVKNELPEETSVHWHGIELPNSEDGAGGTTEYPIKPGESKAYEFTVYQKGTFLYHSGFNMMKQDMYGLAGFFVVHPKKYEKKIDKDFALLIQEWAFLPGNENPNLATMDFNWFTFNGLSAPSIPSLEVKKGERVRIRFGNLSMNSHPIHVHGYSWRVVSVQEHLQKSARWNTSTINIPPGETRDVELVAWNPGVWRIHCHKLHHTVNSHAQIPMTVMSRGGMFTFLHVIDDTNEEWKHPSQIKKEKLNVRIKNKRAIKNNRKQDDKE